jgi:hypothetical protein
MKLDCSAIPGCESPRIPDAEIDFRVDFRGNGHSSRHDDQADASDTCFPFAFLPNLLVLRSPQHKGDQP